MSSQYSRYQIKQKVGEGSMGVVYQAYDPQIDRLVALKVLRPDRATNKDIVQRFIKEPIAIGRLSHPNIVAVYDVGHDQDTVFIAMEFLEGKPLHKVIQEEIPGLRTIINIGIQVAGALDYAHQKGIIHRDIKPANIIVQADGSIKLTDFGIAHIEDYTGTMTGAGDILGSPAYMSPEQVTGRPVDGRSDLYSLGVILYEMCCGKRPFRANNLAALTMTIIKDNPTEPSTIDPAIPKALSQVIMKCLSKQPEERFQTGGELADALKACLNDLDSPPEHKSLESSANPPRSRKQKSHLPLLLLVFILISIAGGGGYYLFLSPKKSQTPASPGMGEQKALAHPSPVVKEQAVMAFLKVESTPVGAQIFVDGTLQGRTPVRLELLSGKHEIRLTLPNYYDWEAQVQLPEKVETPLLVQLMPAEEK
jgi:serine/threonine protein kinase